MVRSGPFEKSFIATPLAFVSKFPFDLCYIFKTVFFGFKILIEFY